MAAAAARRMAPAPPEEAPPPRGVSPRTEGAGQPRRAWPAGPAAERPESSRPRSASAPASTTRRAAPPPSPSSPPAGFAPAKSSTPATQCRRARASAAPIRAAVPTSLLPSFCPRDLVRKHAQLPLIEHRAVHHADQDLFDRAVAEPVDDALHGFGRHPSARLRGVIDIGAAVDGVAGGALLSQPPQHCANRRFLEAAVEPFAHGFRCDRAVGPNQLHHLALEVAQIREGFIHYVSRLLGGICVALQRVAETLPRRKSPAETRAHSLQRRGRDPLGDRAQGGFVATACPVRLEHGELGVGGGASADNGTATVDLGG